MKTHLIDTSVLKRLGAPSVRERFGQLVDGDQLAVIDPVAFEFLRGAKSKADFRFLRDTIELVTLLPLAPAASIRALELQAMFADLGFLRTLSLTDALLAASAEQRKLMVLHYDADFDLVTKHAGIATEWVVPRGSVS